jgi:enoyl-CoA hydratase/carnithine racemase
MGGGMELALACDFRVASRDATLGLPEVNRGLFPGTGGCALLARIVGPVRAKALLLEGATLGAPHWFELGVVNHIAEPGNALAAASEWAQRLAHKPLAATRAIRRMIDHQFIASFAAHLQIELAEYVESFQAADAREGVEAFLEKRAPVWTHR